MSHFTVLVTNTHLKSLDEQMAPFNEELEMAPYIAETRAQIIDEARADILKAKAKYDEWQADTAKYEADCTNLRHIEYLSDEVPGLIEILELNDQDKLYEYGRRWYEDKDLNKKGDHVSTSNPNAKWDWYQIGGRWAGFFKMKANSTGVLGSADLVTTIRVAAGVEDIPDGADVLKVKDIDWEAMEAVERTRRGEYYDEQMGEPEDSRFTWSDNRESDLKSTREEYINRPISHSTFAVLHDGKWYEKGEMGWWAMVSNAKDQDQWDAEFKKLIESLDPEAEVTMVDCHI